AARLGDVALIEERVRRRLPSAMLLPRDLRDAALRNVDRAAALLGPVRIEKVPWIPPLWRPLLNRLCAILPVTWEAPAEAESELFKGEVANSDGRRELDHAELVSCAVSRYEVVESLRWARRLISVQGAMPGEVAIAAASTEAWDEHVLALAAQTGLR